MSRKDIQIRPLGPGDIDQLLQWMNRIADKNLFDPEVLLYKSTATLVAENEKVVLYAPLQTVVILESLAPNPEASELDVAVALRKVVDGVSLLSRLNGLSEVYFLSKDETVNRLAEHHGFERLDIPVLRLKLNKAVLS